MRYKRSSTEIENVFPHRNLSPEDTNQMCAIERFPGNHTLHHQQPTHHTTLATNHTIPHSQSRSVSILSICSHSVHQPSGSLSIAPVSSSPSLAHFFAYHRSYYHPLSPWHHPSHRSCFSSFPESTNQLGATTHSFKFTSAVGADHHNSNRSVPLIPYSLSSRSIDKFHWESSHLSPNTI